MAKKKVSSFDVAHRAGVSRTTVSFVVNNIPGKQITEGTRQKVLRAIDELGYEPDETGRTLALFKHSAIGFFICHTHAVFSDAYLLKLIEGMRPVLNKKRSQLLLQPLGLKQESYLELAQKNGVNGIILINAHDEDEALNELIASGFPLVIIGSLKNKNIPQVDIDNQQAAQEIVSYLIKLKHRKIGMIIHAPVTYYAAKERFEGFKMALQARHLPVMEKWIKIADFSEESGYTAMKEILRQGDIPSAMFAGNDAIAYGVIEAAKEYGLTIPQDISVAGFDDDYLSRYLNPPLTTVAQPAYGLGETAMNLLLSIIGNSTVRRKFEPIILPTNLTIRESCGKV